MPSKNSFSVSLLILLSACATTVEPVQDAPDATDAAGSAAAGLQDVYLAEAIAVDQSEFIGQPAGALETLLGTPAFIRSEGVGEFRRYDTVNCRVYAVITAVSGGRPLIRSISVGGIKVNDPAPSFSECLAAR